MKKKVIAAIIIAVIVIGGGYEIAHSHSTSATTSASQTQGFTVTDSTGQKVHFDKTPTRIVCLDADAYNLVNMLGGDSKVVGVSKLMTMQSNVKKGMAVAGTWQDPNVSKILDLKAQVVLAYAQYTNPKAVQELRKAGVKVLYINGDNIATLQSDVTAIGQITGQTKKAEEFNKMADKYLNLVKERVSKVPQDKRVTAYFEEYKKDNTAGKGSAAQTFLDAAGITNIAANKGQFATVNPAWILQQNPDMIFKIEAAGMGVLGDKVTSTDKVAKAYDQLVSRPGWDALKAVKDNNVHVIEDSYAFSDTNVIPGVLYAAKWAYPDLFKDVNPATVQAQIQKEFFGTKVEGIHYYNGPTKSAK